MGTHVLGGSRSQLPTLLGQLVNAHGVVLSVEGDEWICVYTDEADPDEVAFWGAVAAEVLSERLRKAS